MSGATMIRRGVLTLLASGLLVLVGCEDTLLMEREISIDAIATVRGFAFLDFNGSGKLDQGDRGAGGLRVRLLPVSGGEPVATAETDSTGQFLVDEIPVGTFRMRLDSATVGDTVEVVGFDDEAFTVDAGDTMSVSFYVTYPTLTVPEVRAASPDRKVFTHGIALNPRVSFGDAAVHLQVDSVYLRAIDVPRVPILPGDSLRLLGVTGTRAGQPVLREVIAFRLRQEAVFPRPVDVTTGEAADARSGKLDAALVRIEEAEILDTTTVENDFVATVDDGSGEVELVLRDFLSFNTAALRPDSVLIRRASGLLVPRRSVEGSVRWRLIPRFLSDVVAEQKEFEAEDPGGVGAPVRERKGGGLPPGESR